MLLLNFFVECDLCSVQSFALCLSFGFMTMLPEWNTCYVNVILFWMTVTMCCYLGTYYMDDARIRVDHQRQRQKILNDKHYWCDRLSRSDTAIDSPRCADFVYDVRDETCEQDRISWTGNPERAQDRNIQLALFHLFLQTAQFWLNEQHYGPKDWGLLNIYLWWNTRWPTANFLRRF